MFKTATKSLHILKYLVLVPFSLLYIYCMFASVLIKVQCGAEQKLISKIINH